jgi:hypothetical protein
MASSTTLKETAGKGQKVVFTCQDGTVIKGYFLSEVPDDLNWLARESQLRFDELLALCVSEDGRKLDVGQSKVKAVFFVSSFKGDKEYKPVRFYSSGPEPHSVWVEVVFVDGEVVEGCVQNSIHHLKNDGFFLLPSSPGDNNLLIYVNKAAIAKFRVLGVRMMDNG